jgi:N-acetyl-gamma-glutamyl-phosphate reductase
VKQTVAVVGASGYTGAELLRLLLDHPAVEIAGLYAKASAGQPLARVFPQFAGRLDRTLEPVDIDAAARAGVVFSALPHGESAPVVEALLDRGAIVLDLSADFRLRDPAEHAAWYGHGASAAVRARAVYGQPETRRNELAGARLVAVPGCYPTAAILAAAPLVRAGLVEASLIVDAKSGVSGSGRAATPGTHFAEIGEGIRAYKVAGSHRHTAEMEQELGARVLFTPHLVPMSRGLLACVYAAPTDADRPASAYRDAVVAAYAGEPFVTVLPEGALPDTAHVRGSNRAHVNVFWDARTRRVLAMCAIDNLVKGASGQAVQCLNALLGFPETTGLGGVGLFP